MKHLQSDHFSSDLLLDRQPRMLMEGRYSVHAKPGQAIFGACVLSLALLGTSPQLLAAVTVQVCQIGNDVVVSGSGTINYTDLADRGDGFLFDGIAEGVGLVIGGTDNGCNGCNSGFDAVDLYGGNNDVTEPANLPFGPNDNFIQTALSDGGRLGILEEGSLGGQIGYAIAVPDGYISGSPYAGSSTFANRTLANIGLTPGNYTWTWGAGGNADSITLQIGAVAGDHDGDGKSDILWRNSSTDQNVVWLMDGGARTSMGLVQAPGDTNWKIAGRGDHNGDCMADILWRKSNSGQADDGRMAIWLMQSSARIANLSLPTVPGQEWQVVGNGDYNGDGVSDILWRNFANGENVLWTITAGSFDTNFRLIPVQNLDWTIVSDGDFDGDGKADILWFNTSTRVMSLWRMDGATRVANDAVSTVTTPNWSLLADGDYNGDGKADLFWRSTSGKTVVWLMNGATIASNLTTLYLSNADWQVVGDDGDYNGDNMADLFWRNTTTGINSMWIMDSATRTGHQAVPFQSIGSWNIIDID